MYLTEFMEVSYLKAHFNNLLRNCKITNNISKFQKKSNFA